MLDENDYEIIVSDYQMPEMNGLEFLEKVREDRGNDVPFIIFTGKGREEVAMEALNLGADRYLQKGGSPKTQYGVLAQAIIQEIAHYRTERERDLARKEWRKTFDALPDIVTLISPEFEFLRINEKGAQALGMEKEEIIGEKCYEIVHNQDKPIDACPCEKVIETEEADVGEEFEENGRQYIAAASPVFDENGEIEAFAHTVKDVTERVKAERRFRDFFENIPNQAFIVDADGVIEEVNKAFTEITGYEEGKIVEKPFGDLSNLLPDESLKEIENKFVKLLDGDDISPFTVEYYTKGGGNRQAEINAIQLTGEDCVEKVMGIARDLETT